MKIIFLDIDGVLNSNHYMHGSFYKNETKHMRDAEIMLIAHHTHLDPEAIKLMNMLVEKSGAQVVLSSTWRTKYSPEEMNTMLEGRGATFKVIASTPKLHGKFSEIIARGDEIQAYLDSMEEFPERFVILDDYDNMVHLTRYLVLTKEPYGLRMMDVDRALEILNGK